MRECKHISIFWLNFDKNEVYYNKKSDKGDHLLNCQTDKINRTLTTTKPTSSIQYFIKGVPTLFPQSHTPIDNSVSDHIKQLSM